MFLMLEILLLMLSIIIPLVSSGYRILDRKGITVQRLSELYAEAGLVGFKVTPEWADTLSDHPIRRWYS